jgi:hypothetical protein
MNAVALVLLLGVTQAEPDRRIPSVLDHGSIVVATDGAHLYRATKAERHWTLVETPKAMSMNGSFALCPGAARPLLFHLKRPEFIGVPDEGNNGVFHTVSGVEAWKLSAQSTYGLYGAGPGAEDWELVTADYDFEQVLAAGGLLYGLGSRHQEEMRKDRILQSRDGGRTWIDITHNALDLGIGRCFGLIPDPEHPLQVRLLFQGVRVYVAQAGDDRFLWTSGRQVDAWEEDFFGPHYFYSGIQDSTDYMFPATFGNYFLHPFGNRTWIEPFELTLDQAAYTFGGEGSKNVIATLRFRRADHAAAVMDLTTGTDFWSVRVEDAAGERSQIRSAAELRADADYTGAEREYARTSGLIGRQLISGKTYSRAVDLARLFDFSKPGVYKVQLRYACPFRAGSGRSNWTGGIGSVPVTVTIQRR